MFTQFFVNINTHHLKDEEGGAQMLQLNVEKICLVWHANLPLTGSAPVISVIYKAHLSSLREELRA